MDYEKRLFDSVKENDGCKSWNNWRKKNPDALIDLTNNLWEEILSGADLSKTNLSETDFFQMGEFFILLALFLGIYSLSIYIPNIYMKVVLVGFCIFVCCSILEKHDFINYLYLVIFASVGCCFFAFFKLIDGTWCFPLSICCLFPMFIFYFAELMKEKANEVVMILCLVFPILLIIYLPSVYIYQQKFLSLLMFISFLCIFFNSFRLIPMLGFANLKNANFKGAKLGINAPFAYLGIIKFPGTWPSRFASCMNILAILTLASFGYYSIAGEKGIPANIAHLFPNTLFKTKATTKTTTPERKISIKEQELQKKIAAEKQELAKKLQKLENIEKMLAEFKDNNPNLTKGIAELKADLEKKRQQIKTLEQKRQKMALDLAALHKKKLKEIQKILTAFDGEKSQIDKSIAKMAQKADKIKLSLKQKHTKLQELKSKIDTIEKLKQDIQKMLSTTSDSKAIATIKASLLAKQKELTILEKQNKAIFEKTYALKKEIGKIESKRKEVAAKKQHLQSLLDLENKELKQIKEQVLGTNRALIIANEKYPDPKWSSLATPISDAKAIHRLLLRYYNFSKNNVKFIKNASRKKIYNALKNLIEVANKNDQVLIFYAGHGHLDKITGYWIPVDAKGKQHHSFVSNSDIKAHVTQIAQKCRHTLLISDSCFSGDLLRGIRGTGRGIDIIEKQGASKYFTNKNRYKSCQVITSGSNEYVDDKLKGTQHSPFAYFLIRMLKLNKNPYFSVTHLYTQIVKSVTNASEQTPRYGILKKSLDEGGEFFFVRKK